MTQWQEFLTCNKAEVTNDGIVTSFGDSLEELRAAASGNVLADLSHYGLLEADGDDTVTFLQGQITNDIKQLTDSNSQYAGYCTPKGRLLALFLAFRHHGKIHLQLDRELLEPVAKRLRMFILRSKVTITDVSANLVRIGVAGNNVELALAAVFESLPQYIHATASNPSGTLIRLPGKLPRYEIITDTAHAEHVWNILSKQCRPVGKAGWDWLEIQAGIPEIKPATQEAFVPQMVNLDAIGGISFKKGCYTGQEIVARTHYLGKIKRRTYLAHVGGGQTPSAGDNLFGGVTSEPVGQVVRAAASPNGGFDLLAEIRSESMNAGPVRWHEAPLSMLELPYPLE